MMNDQSFLLPLSKLHDCNSCWHEYERRKREWSDANPSATIAEYDAAIRAIADELEI